MAFDVLIDQVTPGEWPNQTPGGDMVVAAVDPSGVISVTVSGRIQLLGISTDTEPLLGATPLPTASVSFVGSTALSVGGAADVQVKPTAISLAVLGLSGSSNIMAGASAHDLASLAVSAEGLSVKAAALPGSTALFISGSADVQAGVVAPGETTLSLQAMGDVTLKNIPTRGPTPERTAEVMVLPRVAIVPWTFRFGFVPPLVADEPRTVSPFRPQRVAQAEDRFRVATPEKGYRYACVV